MDLSKLKINHWLTGIGAIVLLIVTLLGGSLFPWFKADLGRSGIIDLGTYKEGAGPLGWLALLLGLGAAVLMLLPMLNVKLPENVPWAIIELAAGAGCAVFMLLQLAIGRSYGTLGFSYSLDRSYGLFIAVLAGLAVGGGAALEFLEARKSGGASLGGGGAATPPPPPPSTPPPPPSS